MSKDTSHVSDKYRSIIRLIGISSKDIYPTSKELEAFKALSQVDEEWVLQESINNILDTRSIAALNRHVKNLIEKGYLVRVRDKENGKFMRYKAISQDDLKVVINTIAKELGEKSTISISKLLGAFDRSEQEFVKHFFIEHIVGGVQLFSEVEPEIYKISEERWVEKALGICELRAAIVGPEGTGVKGVRIPVTYMFDILDLFDKNGEMTLSDVSHKLNKDLAYVTQYLNQLLDKGYLKRYKNDNKFTYYLYSKEV